MESEIVLIVEAGFVALAVMLFVFEIVVYFGEITFRGKPFEGLSSKDKK